MARKRGELAQLPAFDLEDARGADAGAVQEGRVLERAGLFDADVEPEGGVGDEDPGVFLRGGGAEEVVHEGGGGEVVELVQAFGRVEGGVGVFGRVGMAACTVEAAGVV